eukprot:TRINITY_DN120165_c0_g1_i1.p1 TRINITY_DN120165_c0_g1~~TRINITY_DN120165_c0_g1_i1.p1  ORF type:complete len:892 (-),score=63.92 TRINITY_DN120165_c0_g1_i1:2141-4816(-)
MDISKQTPRTWSWTARSLQKIFGTFLLLQGQRTKALSLAITFIEQFQFLHFSIIVVLYTLGEDNTIPAREVGTFVNNIISIYPLIDIDSGYSLTVATYTVCALSILAVALPISLMAFHKKFQGMILYHISFYMLDYLSHVLFIPCMGIMQLAIRETLLQESQKELPEISVTILSIFSSVLLTIGVTIYKRCATIWGLTSLPGVYFHILRSLFIVLFVTFPTVFNEFFYGAAYFIGSLSLLYVHLTCNALYSLKMERLLTMLYGVYVGIGGILCVSYTVHKDKVGSALLGGIFVIALLVPIFSQLSEWNHMHMMTRSLMDCKSRNEAIKFCVAQIRFLQLINQIETPEQKALAQQLIACHVKGCTEVFCPLCETFNHRKLPKETIKAKLINRTMRIIRQASSTYPQSTRLKILECFYNMQYMRDYLSAWVIIEFVERKNQSVLDLPMIKFCKELIEKAMTRSEKQSQRNIFTTKLQKMQDKFRRKILETTKTYVRWWDTLLESTPSLTRFKEIGLALLENTSIMRKMWKEAKRLPAIPQLVLYLYVKFCENIRGDNTKVKRLKLQYSNRNVKRVTENSATSFTVSEEGILAVSVKKETMGNIVLCNKTVSRILGYLPGELVNRNLLMLIPPIYHESHLKGFRKSCALIEYGEKVEGFNKEAYIVGKAGYLIPIILRTVDLPHMMNGHIFVVSVSLPKDYTKYTVAHMLLDPKKRIIGITANCKMYLGVTLNILKQPVEEVISSFNFTAEDQEQSFNYGTYKYKSILSQEKELLGYKVRIIEKQTQVSELKWSIQCPLGQFSFDARCGKYILREGGNNDLKAVGEETQEVFEAKTDAVKDKVLSIPKGYYGQIYKYIVSHSIDPSSISLWSKVKPYLLIHPHSARRSLITHKM